MLKTLLPFVFLAATAAHAAVQIPSSPYVVIFDGKSICDGCDTPFVNLFRDQGYSVVEVKPGQSTPELLAGTTLYIVPGGDDVTSLEDAWTEADLQSIREYVRRGGRYYGVCLGGYSAGHPGTWAGTIPGFEALDIIPAKVLEKSPDDKKDKVLDIFWEGQPRRAYFQDGPSFVITDASKVLKIYATYADDHSVATFMSSYGSGRVAVSGVHIEATQDWYDDYHLVAPPGLNRDLQSQILNELLSN